jgi:hypothetical protein
MEHSSVASTDKPELHLGSRGEVPDNTKPAALRQRQGLASTNFAVSIQRLATHLACTAVASIEKTMPGIAAPRCAATRFESGAGAPFLDTARGWSSAPEATDHLFVTIARSRTFASTFPRPPNREGWCIRRLTRSGGRRERVA